MVEGRRSAYAEPRRTGRPAGTFRRAARRTWSPTSWGQFFLFAAALLVAATMVAVAQSAREGAERAERAEVLVEAVRADGQQVNAIRAQALADAEARLSQPVSVSDAAIQAGWAASMRLEHSLAQLQALEPAIARRLRTETQTLVALGLSTLHRTSGKTISPQSKREQLAFQAVAERLDNDAERAATHEQQVAGDATTNAQRAFVGSLVLGFIALLIIAGGFDRLRRKLAVDETRRALELESEARLRALLEHSSDVVTVVGIDLRVRWQAASITRVLGLGAESLIGEPLTAIVHPGDAEAVEQFLTAALTRSSSQPLTLRLRHADGGWRTVEAVANNRVADPAIGGLVLSLRDATERKELEDQLRHQAYHDSLTALANRSLFENRLFQAVAIAQRTGREFAVLFLDLDDFKTINDSLGHAHGDELLRDVATRIRGIVRPTDTAARLGGDEFAVLLEIDADEREAYVVAERLLEELSYPLKLGERELRITASIGVALTSGAGGVDELMRNADMAMYAAKADGKCAVRTFEPDMHRRAVERLELTGELRAALENDEFLLEYQPIVELTNARIVGLEALVRWQHPSRQRVGPDQFISVSEDTGLIVPLGRWILETACAQSRRWQLEHPGSPLQLSVNVSTRQLREPDFVSSVREVLARTALPAERLTLEITEGVLIGDREEVVSRLQDIKALGVRLAVDDFGTGYSSLSHLRYLPIDTLKIDKSFIDGIEHDVDKANLVRGIVNLGRSLHLELVAEGIERIEQVNELADIDAPLAQGYLFHPPLPAVAIDRLLDDEDGLTPAGSGTGSSSRAAHLEVLP